MKCRKSFTECGVPYHHYVLVNADATEEEIIRAIKSVLLEYSVSDRHLKVKPILSLDNAAKYSTVYISEFDDLDSKKKMQLITEASVKNLNIRVFKTLSNDEIEIYKQRFKK